MKHWLVTNWQEICRDFNRQEKCRHLKGYKMRGILNRDYNVSIHTFPDAARRIRCLYGCGFQVWDKPEFRFKWQYGMKMVNQSTNTPSASQVMLPKISEEETRVVCFENLKI